MPAYTTQGPRTEKGLRTNISVGLTYLEAWLGGNGCIPIHNMMEDAATAEIARTQVRQGKCLRPSISHSLCPVQTLNTYMHTGGAAYTYAPSGRIMV